MTSSPDQKTEMELKTDALINSARSDPDGGNAEIPTSKSDGSEETDKKKKKQTTVSECEFQVAADLTLYANPLRCLSKKTSSHPAPLHRIPSDADMIAADLVKYGSPLDDKPNGQ